MSSPRGLRPPHLLQAAPFKWTASHTKSCSRPSQEGNGRWQLFTLWAIRPQTQFMKLRSRAGSLPSTAALAGQMTCPNHLLGAFRAEVLCRSAILAIVVEYLAGSAN